MIKITTKFDIKKIKSEIEKTAIQEIRTTIQNNLTNIKCEIHNKYPSIEITGKNLDNLKFSIKACCQEFKDSIANKLSKIFNSQYQK